MNYLAPWLLTNTLRDKLEVVERSDLHRRPVGRIDKSDLLQQIRSSAYTLHRVHQRILVLDVQRAVISNGPKVVHEVGPERRAVGMAESEGHVVPGARTRFRDGDRVQQPVTR